MRREVADDLGCGWISFVSLRVFCSEGADIYKLAPGSIDGPHGPAT
jgi:hypothetical protein